MEVRERVSVPRARALRTRQRRGWLVASGSCLIAAGALAGCGETEPARGGLMLIVSSDGPLALDRLEIEIGTNDKSLLSNKYRVPQEVSLPTTVAIVSNGDAAALAKISVTGWAANVPLDRRDAIVTQIPTDRVAALNVVLSARCSEKLKVNNEGSAVSSCGDGNTCDNLGNCVPATVQAPDLATYHAGDENDVGLGGASFGGSRGGDLPGGSSPGGSSPGGSGGEMEAGGEGGDGAAGASGTSGVPSAGTGGAAPLDPCAGLACDDPPVADCVSASQFKSYDKPGSCADGKCSYSSHLLPCTCQNHACTTDPCALLTCTNSVCVAGACQGVCAPPQTRCSGAIPQTCTASGTWRDEAVTAGQCGAACTPGTTQCSGLTAQQTCNASGAWPAAVGCTNQTCVGTGIGSSCTGVCAQGQTKCANADQQSCTVTGTWGTSATCPAPQVCQSGACACPASAPSLCNNNCTNYQTDKFNCGSCGHSCQGGSCSGGICQPLTLFTSGAAPVNIAVSSSTVYWTDSSTGVNTLPLGGGTVPGWVSLGGSCGIMGLALDSTNIYGIARDTCALGSGSLMTAPMAGGAATKVNTGSLGNGAFPSQAWRCLAVDGTNAYFTNYDTDTVFKIPKAGGTTTMLSQFSGNNIKGIAVQGTNVFWGASNAGMNGIMRQAISGGSAVAIATKADGGFLSVDGSYVYYTNAGALMKALISGSTPVTLVSSGATGAVAIDASNVYYLGASTVMMVSKLGGTVTTLASGQTSPVDIAVDASSVYWLAGNAVLKRAL
ncbi:MAG: hypothetical protein WDO74_03400 [Pseudomonadota bacterium]